jgi:SAM-dependent methyltransferase
MTADDPLTRGTIEHYDDPALYDYEYRRRRFDVRFYRRLAHHFGSPVLELGCGTARVALPLVRDGHQVVGIDCSARMLRRALDRRQRLAMAKRSRLLCVLGDMHRLPLSHRFPLVIAAFNTLQHVYRSDRLIALLDQLRRHLSDGGCLAFDVLNPDLAWLTRDPRRRWARTRFTHPVSGERLIYTTNHTYDPIAQIAMINIYYDPVDAATGPPRMVRLAHRQYFPQELRLLVRASGLAVAGCYGGFCGEPLEADSESQVLVCCHPRHEAAVVRRLADVLPAASR